MLLYNKAGNVLDIQAFIKVVSHYHVIRILFDSVLLEILTEGLLFFK